MQRALFCCGLFVLIAAGCNQGGADSPVSASATSGVWKDFSPEGEQFSIKMPGEPKPQPIADSSSKSWEIDAGNVGYRIGYKKLFNSAIGDNLTETEQQFDTFTEMLRFTQDSEVVEEKKHLNVAGVTGREISALTPDKKSRRIRICIAGGRFYQIDVTGSKEAVNSPDAEVFFNSLKFVQ